MNRYCLTHGPIFSFCLLLWLLSPILMGIQSQHSWKTSCTPPAQSGSSPTFGERTRETCVGLGEKYPHCDGDGGRGWTAIPFLVGPPDAHLLCPVGQCSGPGHSQTSPWAGEQEMNVLVLPLIEHVALVKALPPSAPVKWGLSPTDPPGLFQL